MVSRMAIGFACAMLACASAMAQPVVYVDDDAPPGGDGQSWPSAHQDLQAAIADASNPAVTEIRVAGGTYKPSAQSEPGVPRSETFTLLNNVAIRGGYRGLAGGGDANDRDIVAFETILSGDIGATGVLGDNAYHVVTVSGTDPTAVLDGVTIKNGYAVGGASGDRGAGMINSNGSPTLTDCTFSTNQALEFGAGMCNSENAAPTLTGCTFDSNGTILAEGKGGGMYNNSSDPTLTGCIFSSNEGGGVWNDNGSSVSLTECTFLQNTSGYANGGGGLCNNDSTSVLAGCMFSQNAANNTLGGGMLNANGSTADLADCVFDDNNADNRGGGIQNSADSTITLSRCTFTANVGDLYGGGMQNYGAATLVNCSFSGNTAAHGFGGGVDNVGAATLTNCLFSGNRSGARGGGLSNTGAAALANCTFSGNHTDGWGGGIENGTAATLTVANCVVWGNTADASAPQIEGSATVNHSCVEGGWAGAGNVASDPLFVNAAGPDGTFGTDDDDLRLGAGSPCIDSANNTAVPADVTDLDGDSDVAEQTPLDLGMLARFQNDPATPDSGIGTAPVVDMGAYEFESPPPVPKSADLDDDGDVDLDDFALFQLQFTGPLNGRTCLFIDYFEREAGEVLGNGWVEAERAGTRENGNVLLAENSCMKYALLVGGAELPGQEDDEPMAWMAMEGINVQGHANVSLSYDWAGHGDVNGGFDRMWVEWKDCADSEWPVFEISDTPYDPDGVIVQGIRQHELTSDSQDVFTHVRVDGLDFGGTGCIDLRFRVIVSQPDEGAKVDNIRLCGTELE